MTVTTAAFQNDWNYLVQRLDDYHTKYKIKIEPHLTCFLDNKEKICQLQLETGGKIFNASRFADPTEGHYEAGQLKAGKDVEEFLNERLSLKEWDIALRFGAFTPYTFSVLGNTSPIGFLVGAEWMYYWKVWGMALEYDYGSAGVFPDSLNDVNSGDSIRALPLGKDLPLGLEFHTLSSTLLLHATFFAPSSHTHISAGAGPFYEHGEVEKKRFDIVSENGELKVKVNASQDAYDSAGPRGRVGVAWEMDGFHVGTDLIVDFGLPLDGKFEDFNRYLFRGMLSLAVGYRHF